jgi:hypothetical protein
LSKLTVQPRFRDPLPLIDRHLTPYVANFKSLPAYNLLFLHKRPQAVQDFRSVFRDSWAPLTVTHSDAGHYRVIPAAPALTMIIFRSEDVHTTEGRQRLCFIVRGSRSARVVNPTHEA